MATATSTKRLGFWSATSACVLSVAYVIAQILEWVGLLGSGGGPESASTPLGLALLLTPSLLLGPAYVIAMAALHIVAPPSKKAFTLAALAFAIAYATLTGLVYFVQLTLVAPRMAAGDTADISFLLFVPYRSFLFAVDLLGYSFMSVSTLLAAFGLPSFRVGKWAKAAMIANGLLLPFLAFQMFYPALIWPAAAWAITFPMSAALLARLFKALP
jgi:hypothetical protein